MTGVLNGVTVVDRGFAMLNNFTPGGRLSTSWHTGSGAVGSELFNRDVTYDYDCPVEPDEADSSCSGYCGGTAPSGCSCAQNCENSPQGCCPDFTSTCDCGFAGCFVEGEGRVGVPDGSDNGSDDFTKQRKCTGGVGCGNSTIKGGAPTPDGLVYALGEVGGDPNGLLARLAPRVTGTQWWTIEGLKIIFTAVTGVYGLARTWLKQSLKSFAKKARRPSMRGCFVAGTVVETKDGPVRIEQLEPGDVVLSRSPESGLTEYQAVSAVFVRQGIETFHLAVVEEDGSTEVLETTARHPFWVNDRGWVNVEDLAKGDELRSASGKTLSVYSLSATGNRKTVHNIEVEGHHTYFVGRFQIWVHNKSAFNPKITKQMEKAGLPQGGEIPFRPQTIMNKKGNPIIKKAEITHGPKAGKKGYVDQEGRIWVRDRAHGNHPDHWDVQINGGESYLNVGMDGNFSH